MSDRPPRSHGRWVLLAAVALAVTAVVAAPSAYRFVERKGAALHQRSITRELAEWEREDSVIESDEDAKHAEGMLGYIRRYYVPGPGYRSDPDTEAALEAQRAKTLAAIEAALREYRARRPPVEAPRPVSRHVSHFEGIVLSGFDAACRLWVAAHRKPLPSDPDEVLDALKTDPVVKHGLTDGQIDLLRTTPRLRGELERIIKSVNEATAASE